MLTADLVVTDSGSATKPGVLGAKTFALVISDSAGTLRRIAATALTTPQEFAIKSQFQGSGWKQRCRTAVSSSYTRIDTDTSLTGGVTPTTKVTLTIDRPVISNGYIVAADIKNLVGQVIDALTVSGQLDKILNAEG